MRHTTRRLWLGVMSSLLALAHAGEPFAQDRPRLVESLDVHVPRAPAPFSAAGSTRLAYEIHLTNFNNSDAQVEQITVRDAASGESLLDLRGASLENSLRQSGSSSNRTLAAGAHTVAFVWLTLSASEQPPKALVHEVGLEWIRSQGREASRFRTEPLSVASERVPVLGAPLRGGPWVALYDPAMPRGHRRSIYTFDGHVRIPGRYAIDWIRLGQDGSYARGDRARLTNWHGYGEEVLAVADGIVIDAVDDMRSSDTIGAAQGPMALEAASGNHIVLDIGAGRYAFYEHLQHGSLRVARGDRVRKGDVIAALGNSGSSSFGPHLHFHLADAPATLAAEGLPFVFDSFEVLGRFENIETFVSGERWQAPLPRQGGPRKAELPDANVVLMFKE